MNSPNTSQGSAGRMIYLDILRIVAMIAVVTLHVLAGFIVLADTSSTSWHIMNIADSAIRWAAPVFIMISGSLFLDNDKPLSIRKLYTKHLLRIVTAFVFWSIIYAAFFPGWPDKSLFANLCFGCYHFWFLYVIAGLYILTPILRKISESEKVMEYFLLAAVIFAYIIPMLFKLTSIDSINYISNSLEITFGYTPYFILGYYLQKKDLNKRSQNIIYILGIAGFAFTAVTTAIFSKKAGYLDQVFYDYPNLNIFFESAAVFTFGKYKLSKLKFGEKAQKNIITLSKYTFGIYLCHVVFIRIFQKIGFGFSSSNTLWIIPLSVIIFLLALIVSAVLNHIPFLKKYIV